MKRIISSILLTAGLTLTCCMPAVFSMPSQMVIYGESTNNGSSNDDKTVWNYLIGRGLTQQGAAALMGNLYAESGLKSMNLQNYYERIWGTTDSEYTENVDNATYTNFENDKAGYGLAQWTFHTRKRNLLTFATIHDYSIGDLGMQLEFLYYELSSYYVDVLKVLCTTTDIKEASDLIISQYEKPTDQSEKEKNSRAQFAQSYFDKFADKNVVIDTSGTFNVGDIVEFTGTIHYFSSMSNRSSSCKPGKAQITKYCPGRSHPYHIVAEKDGGSTVFGWVNESQMKAITSVSETETPEATLPDLEVNIPPAPEAPVQEERTLQIGDEVTFIGGDHYYSSKREISSGVQKPGNAIIIDIAEGALHPYQIKHTDNNSRVYGWVDADSIK